MVDVGPLLGGCMLMNSRGGPSFIEGAPSRDNLYESSSMYIKGLRYLIFGSYSVPIAKLICNFFLILDLL